MEPAQQAPYSPIGFLLVTASRLMRRRFEHALAEAGLGVTPDEARTMAVADRIGPVKQAELADALNIEPMTLVRHLDRLEGQGLIARSPDPRDRRGKRVSSTPQAGPHLMQIRSVLEAARSETMTGFSEAQTADLQALLEQLCEALGHDPAFPRADR